MGGTGAIQLLRLASTLTLSRLLAPNAFGLMALVGGVVSAVALFSEVGLHASVIHDRRGDDPDFLNVIWTLQVIRGVVITGVVCLLAWPSSVFYREPQLFELLLGTSATAILSGLCSTSVLSLTRHLQPGKIVISQVVAKFISLIVMIVLAWQLRSAWAIVLGTLVEQFVVTATSFGILPGRKDRFRYDRDVARSLFHFGRWTWVSAVATWLLDQGDRLFFGRVLSAEDLGVYSIATIIPSASIMIVDRLAQRVLQPFYASVIREDPQSLRRRVFKVRVGFSLVAHPMLWVLIVAGGPIVDLIYDPRYSEAGWMCRLLAVAAVATNTIGGAERVFLAEGDSYRHMVIKLIGGALFVLSLVVGAYLGGIRSMVVSVVVSRFLAYVPLAWALHKRGIWLPHLDLGGFAITGGVTLLAHMYDPIW